MFVKIIYADKREILHQCDKVERKPGAKLDTVILELWNDGKISENIEFKKNEMRAFIMNDNGQTVDSLRLTGSVRS